MDKGKRGAPAPHGLKDTQFSYIHIYIRSVSERTLNLSIVVSYHTLRLWLFDDRWTWRGTSCAAWSTTVRRRRLERVPTTTSSKLPAARLWPRTATSARVLIMLASHGERRNDVVSRNLLILWTIYMHRSHGHGQMGGHLFSPGNVVKCLMH